MNTTEPLTARGSSGFITVTYTTFTQCQQISDENTCGIWVYSGSYIVLISDSTFSFNNGSCHSGTGTLLNCTIQHNVNPTGDILLTSSASSPLQLDDCTVFNNTAYGIIGVAFGEFTATNTHFIQNTSPLYGIALSLTTGSITNCTFVSNIALTGGAMYLNSVTSLYVTNSRFLQNGAQGNNILSIGGAVYMKNSCIFTLFMQRTKSLMISEYFFYQYNISRELFHL